MASTSHLFSHQLELSEALARWHDHPDASRLKHVTEVVYAVLLAGLGGKSLYGEAIDVPPLAWIVADRLTRKLVADNSLGLSGIESSYVLKSGWNKARTVLRNRNRWRARHVHADDRAFEAADPSDAIERVERRLDTERILKLAEGMSPTERAWVEACLREHLDTRAFARRCACQRLGIVSDDAEAHPEWARTFQLACQAADQSASRAKAWLRRALAAGTQAADARLVRYRRSCA